MSEHPDGSIVLGSTPAERATCIVIEFTPAMFAMPLERVQRIAAQHARERAAELHRAHRRPPIDEDATG